MKRHLPWALPTFIIGAFVTMMGPVLYYDFRDAKAEVRIETLETYTAWCKLEHRTDLKFEEWDRLRRMRLLNRK